MRRCLLCLVLALPLVGQDPVAAARAAVAAAEERTGADSLETAEALLKLLQAMANAPPDDEVLAIAERVVAIREAKIPGHQRFAIALSNLANVHMRRNRQDLAVPILERARQVLEATPPSRAMLGVLGNLGMCQVQRGEYLAAREVLERAVAYGRQHAPDHPLFAQALQNLAAALLPFGESERARELVAETLAVLEKAERDGRRHAHAVYGLGHVLLGAHRLDEAEPLLRRGLELCERHFGPDDAMTRNAEASLAWLYRLRGDLGRARHHIERAIGQEQRAPGPQNDVRHRVQFARILALQGDTVRALAVVEAAIAASRAAGSGDELLFPMLTTQGELLVANRDWSAAVPVLRRAIEVGMQLGVEGNHALHAARGALASACWQLGERQAAIAALGANLDWFGGHLERVLPALAESDRLRTVALHREAIDRLLAWTADQPALLPPAEVYARVLAWKGQVARGALDKQRTALGDAEGAARMRRLQQIVGEVAMGRADDAMRAERERLVAAISRVATTSVAPSVAAVQSALPYRAALVDFVLVDEPGGGRRYRAFVLRGRHVFRVDLGPAEPIEQSARSWLQLLARSTKPGVQGVAAPVGRDLRQRVFEPLAAAIGESTRLFVCPDAALATLPFETLPDGDKGAFLVERLSISYLQDATELMRAPMEDPGSTLLAFGDIDYGASSAASSAQRGVPRPFAPLPATANELAVFERLPNITTTLVRGKAASEQRLRESISGAVFVHLATHGFCGVADAGEPQAVRAGVALAGANDAPGVDDGIVGVDEAALLDLRNCRLAVLSACQTGLGEPFAGESLLGLRRALRIAGAKATVTSLWRVDDAATAQLMADFYTTLFGDERDPALALREAQLQALARARAAHGGEGLPGLWGAFVTEGR